MAIFFTADHHFGHKNIMTYEDRPFDNTRHMDEELIRRWNEKIGERDQVYHLGDVSIRKPESTIEILERLNGKIHLIKGNHDKSMLKPPCSERFEWIKDYYFLKIPNGPMIALMHYCLRVWERKHHGAWHFFGHSHGNLPEVEGELALNVGVDCWDYSPVSMKEITSHMEKKKRNLKGLSNAR